MRGLDLLGLVLLFSVLHQCDSQYDFNCNGTGIGNTDRVRALLAHNDLRLKVASGGQQDGKNGGPQTLTKTNDMYEVGYNCDLEEMAKTYVTNCGEKPSPVPRNGVNIVRFTVANDPGLTAPLVTAMAKWAAQVSAANFEWSLADNKAKAAVLDFSNMIYYKTLDIGCYQWQCSPDNPAISSAACVYDQPQVVVDTVVYPPGGNAVCTADAGCAAYTPSKCQTSGSYAGLCLKEAETTTTATTTMPGATTTPTNANPNPAINQICPVSAVMNDRIRVKALDMHNYRRSLLAKGEVVKNTGNQLPTGANIYKLRYNCDLETIAEASVARCSSTPDSRVPTDMQQNILVISKNSAQYRLDSIEAAIKDWWSQVRKVDGPGMQVTYRLKHEGSPISYMTRMAWATTSNLGCAVSVREACGNNWVNACIYSPGGNVPDQAMYIVGTPCSQCPNGSFCDANQLCEIR